MDFDYHILQIEMAANGCVSGTLGEWPHLKLAIAEISGSVLPNETPAVELKNICRDILEGLDVRYS